MWFKKQNKIPTEKSTAKQRIYLPKLWPYRFVGNLLFIGFIILVAFGIYVIKTNFVSQKLTNITDYFISATSKFGFKIDDIIVNGRNKTPLKEIHNVINLHYGDNIFAPDIHVLQSELEQLPWIEKATIKRSYFPNILEINITERQIKAIWQINGELHPIDINGNIVHTDKIPNIPLLVIIGKGAPQHLSKLIPVIQQDEELYSRVKAANFISNRRWNIILDDVKDGITIKLPARNFDKAWKKLLKLNKTRGLLKRKLTIIDLRFDNKILVTPRKLSEKEYQGLHQNKEQKL
ncbi:MAG: FtsQ-type POTRA domain-containing protein [Alphaproteobacteria bacterium]|nr:FtsQ-type POTRA domain-containing protein [Alphaproteobacteria bacterium]